MSKYKWKMQAFAKGIDAEAAVLELERIESVYGALTPENVLAAATPDDSVLHPLFEWDDSTAAHKFRLQQARTIINNVEIRVVSDGEPRYYAAFEMVKEKDTGSRYKNITEFTEDDIKVVKTRTIREINSLKYKLTAFNVFSPVVTKLDEAIDETEKIVE